MLQINVSRNDKGLYMAEATINERHITGSSDTVAGALHNIAVAVKDGGFETPLMIQFSKEAALLRS